MRKSRIKGMCRSRVENTRLESWSEDPLIRFYPSSPADAGRHVSYSSKGGCLTLTTVLKGQAITRVQPPMMDTIVTKE